MLAGVIENVVIDTLYEVLRGYLDSNYLNKTAPHPQYFSRFVRAYLDETSPHSWIGREAWGMAFQFTRANLFGFFHLGICEF